MLCVEGPRLLETETASYHPGVHRGAGAEVMSWVVLWAWLHVSELLKTCSHAFHTEPGGCTSQMRH